MKLKVDKKKYLIPALIVVILISISIVFIQLWKIYQNERQKNYIDLDSVGGNCRIERACDDLVGVDCGAAYDGPYFYVERKTGKIVSRCGGYCMTGKCNNCPPKEWKCDTY